MPGVSLARSRVHRPRPRSPVVWVDRRAAAEQSAAVRGRGRGRWLPGGRALGGEACVPVVPRCRAGLAPKDCEGLQGHWGKHGDS